MGTPAYMSPEQAAAKPLDARSDVFSFGAVLYELLAGTPAFAGDSTAQIISAVLRDDPRPSEAPAALQQVIKRCLAKDPDRRFQTMADVKLALQHLTGRGADATPSIAVLPFANLSADPEQDYFSDGLADEIISALAKIHGLKVIARTSAFAFKGQHTDIRKIADTLGVTNILEGSVRRAGNRIRVTVQLVNAADGSHRWSERYDRQMADVFDVQDEIAAAIASALRVALASGRDTRPRHTPNLPAYEALLTARHFHWQVRGESMERAGQFYERAIALDPQYALAHALYADYLFGRTTVGMSPMRDVAPLIRSAALRALELDPQFPDAHSPLALVAATHDYDWAEADRRFDLAIRSGVISPLSRMGFGWAGFLGSGRGREAVEQLERAVQEDPLHLTYRTCLALALGSLERFDDADAVLAKSREIDPDFFWTYDVLASHYIARDMMTEAHAAAERTFTLAPWYPPGVGTYAGVLVRAGEGERGHAAVRSLGPRERYGVSIGWARFHLACGELESAAEWFVRAIDERYSMVGALLHSASAGSLRRSAHWPPLARLMNLST
jgi:serine/threonine-protein kinase